MTKSNQEKISPLIKAMAEWAVDDALADYDAGLPRRKRLSREYFKKELAKEAPARVKPKKSAAKAKRRKRVAKTA